MARSKHLQNFRSIKQNANTVYQLLIFLRQLCPVGGHRGLEYIPAVFRVDNDYLIAGLTFRYRRKTAIHSHIHKLGAIYTHHFTYMHVSGQCQ